MTVKRIHDRETERAMRVDHVAELIPATEKRAKDQKPEDRTVSEPLIAGEPANDPWFTVNFIPATEPLVLYLLNHECSGTQTQRVAGWLVQHRHSETPGAASTTVEDSRVVAGVLEPELGAVVPVNCEAVNFIGVFPVGESPSPEDVEEQREIMVKSLRST
jgi:hypothetical protein